MQNIEIDLAAVTDGAIITRVLEGACRSAGMRCTLKDTLRGYPGCIHWHFKNGDEPGTLEVTYWPEQHRAWFSIQARRNADWIDEAMTAIRKSVRAWLRDSRRES